MVFFISSGIFRQLTKIPNMWQQKCIHSFKLSYILRLIVCLYTNMQVQQNKGLKLNQLHMSVGGLIPVAAFEI